jgi:hypothetical protein
MKRKMSKSQENLKDVTFICERVIWYLKQKPEELIEYFKEHRLDALYSISDPNRGMIICGLEASKRFTDIAERFLSTQEEKKRKANLSKVIGNLKEEFSRRFIQRGEEISQRNIDRMIASAYKLTSKKFESIRHFIPCTIFLTKSIKSFEVGPVQFLHESKFFDSYKKEIQALREEIKVDHQARCRSAVSEGFPEDRIATEKQSEQLANRLVDGLLDFNTQYEWFAVVDIGECDSTVLYNKAVFTTKTALNILKLLLGGQYTDRLRTAQDYGLPHKRAKLTRGADGKLDISLSSIPGGNVLGDDWFEFLSTKAEYFFKLASRALAFSVEFSEIPPLCTRFIDSLSWYGDAISEKSPAAKIVKYVSSIERMTGTGIESDENVNERGVTEIVTNRSSILYSNATGKSLDDCFREVNHIYECRSNLLHGSISPFDDSVVSDSYKAEEISRLILLTGLDFFNSLGLDNPTMNQRQLRGHYNDLEKMHLQRKRNNP